MARLQCQSGHQLQLLQGSSAYFAALVRAFDDSRFEIRLETYIFDVYGGGASIALALERAAERGVSVFVAVDGVGSPTLPAPWPERLTAAGVQWRVFRPLGHLGLLVPSRWRRLHRKLCVVDRQLGFCGGINVLDDWFDPNHGALLAPRFDFAVRVTGPLVQQVHTAMTQFWWHLEVTERAKRVDLRGALQALHRPAGQASRANAQEPASEGTRAELVLRDNLRFRTRIERAYRQALGEAQHDIIIANAYFLPGRKIRKSLIHAAQRGVRVRLLLQGRYEYFMQYHAAHALYTSLLAAGIEIYEYMPSFMHAKVAVIDDHWATVGSSNMDPLSLLLAREANLVIHNPSFAMDLRHCLEQAMLSQARQVDAQQHAKRALRLRVFDIMAYSLMHVLLFVNGKRY